MIPGSANPLLLKSAAAAGGYQVSRSLRFNSSDSAYLSRTPAVAGNRTTWTWAGWVKRSALGTRQQLFSAPLSSNGTYIEWQNDLIGIEEYTSGFVFKVAVAAVQRDPSAWYHIVFAFDTTIASPSSDRVKIYINGILQTSLSSSSYPSQNHQAAINATTLHKIGAFPNPGDAGNFYYFNGYLADIHFIDGQALTPSSFTEVSATTGQLIPKTYTGTYGTNGFQLKFADNSAATATTLGKDTSGNGNNWTPNNFSVYSGTTQGVNLRDSSRITLSGGRTGATNTALLVDGVLTYSQTFYGNPGANGSYIDFSTSGLTVGSTVFVRYWNAGEAGGQTITATCDQRNSGGTQIASTAVAQTWTPGQKYNDGTGYISQTLQSGVSTIRLTFSGNSNNSFGWGVGEIEFLDGSGNDSLVDTPTSTGTDTGVGGEVLGNYATLNPLLGSGTKSDGNLVTTTPNTYSPDISTIAPSSGKWYAEIQWTSGAYARIGIQNATVTSSDFGEDAYGWRYESNTGTLYGPSTSTSGSVYSNGDIIGIAFDCSTGKLWVSKNNTWQNSGNPAAGTNASATNLPIGTPLAVAMATGTGASVFTANFGQRPFAYTAPSGFKALCDTNLPAPVVAKPNTVMDVVTYTGNGSTQTLPNVNSTPTTLGFSPDLVWIKARSQGTDWHALFNTIVGPTKRLFSNSTTAEATNAQTLTAFNSDGFSVGNTNEVNGSSTTYVAWTWDAGTSTVSNPDGSITSQVRANASAGFSVVTYSGNSVAASTVGHGLGVTPSMVIVKRRNSAIGWYVSHVGYPNTSLLFLESTSALATSEGTRLQRTSSTVFTVGDAADYSVTNQSGGTYVAYCFAPVVGYSSMGSYVGNGSTDGPFVYTGFRPRWVMIKCSSSDQAGNASWRIFDTARSNYNVIGPSLYADDAIAEVDSTWLDVISNGFKIRTTSTGLNASGATYIYAAFAENPFQYARAR